MADELATECAARFWEAYRGAPFDTFVASTIPSIRYITGYYSLAKALHATHDMVVVCREGRALLVTPSGDLTGALAAGVDPDDVVTYGTFFFESEGSTAPETVLAGQYDSFSDALREAVARLSSNPSSVGIEETGLTPRGHQSVVAVFGAARTSDASGWMRRVRAVKTPGEVARLTWAANLAEKSMRAAFQEAHAGWTELEIAAVVARVMSEGGGVPTQLSVQVGTRTTHGDAYPTTRRWMPGDLLRLDVGCTVDGYWSDIARTGVLGEPTKWQVDAHQALLAGEQEEIASVREGVTCEEIFNKAVAAVQGAGMSDYRRTHCGHGIGLEVYDEPLIGPNIGERLEAGMVLCLETPYYFMGRGGILVEDTVVITKDGCQSFTSMDRDLWRVEA